jgi:hypothetical protein
MFIQVKIEKKGVMSNKNLKNSQSQTIDDLPYTISVGPLKIIHNDPNNY